MSLHAAFNVRGPSITASVVIIHTHPSRLSASEFQDPPCQETLLHRPSTRVERLFLIESVRLDERDASDLSVIASERNSENVVGKFGENPILEKAFLYTLRARDNDSHE